MSMNYNNLNAMNHFIHLYQHRNAIAFLYCVGHNHINLNDYKIGGYADVLV